MSDENIQQVKEAWEKKLMSFPGVLAIGIGRSKQTGEVCIKVYISRDSHENTKELIPQNIEGYPVEIQVRGTFRSG